VASSDRPHVASNGAAPPTGFLLEEHVGFLLRKAHQRHAAIFLETASKAGLTPTQFAALCKTAEVGKVTQNHLGRMVAMDPATIQGVVRRLTARGLLARTHDPMDRRTAVLAATEAGLELIGDAVASARRAHDTALAPLSDDERQVFLTLLQKMV
jgi:DNA-binding MarR family transcriptional regulator